MRANGNRRDRIRRRTFLGALGIGAAWLRTGSPLQATGTPGKSPVPPRESDGPIDRKDSSYVNDFDHDGEGWQIYDYNGGIAGGGNVFFPVTWERSGGVRNTGYVWGEDSRWRIDTPENPHSILAFILYRRWLGAESVDLRSAQVSVHLRGDGLDLKGGRCFFWVLNQKNGTRWHHTGRPIKISEGKWGDPESFTLRNEESLWHRSWSRDPSNPGSLDLVLGKADSYGFSFLGFSEEVTGKFSMDEFQIKPAAARA